MVTLAKLLRDGYFPKELPPCFSASTFAEAASSCKLPPAPSRTAKLARHSIARTGQIRRELGAPNPSRQLELSQLIARNWNTFDEFYRQSALTLSAPTISRHLGGRALTSSLGSSSIAEQRALRRTTDNSIYTHSIP